MRVFWPSKMVHFTEKIVFKNHAGKLNPKTNQVMINGAVYESICDFVRLDSQMRPREIIKTFHNPLCAAR